MPYSIAHASLRRALVHALLVSSSLACASVAHAQGTAAPRGAARSASDTLAYVYLNGADTVAVERIVQRPDGVRGELVVKNQPRIVWHQSIGAGNSVGNLDLDAYAVTATAGARPMQSVTLRTTTDSGFMDVHANGSTNTTVRIGIPPGTGWMLNSSVLHTDVLATLAARRGQNRLNIVLTQGGQQLPVTIRATADTTVVTMAGSDLRFVHDALGLKEVTLTQGQTVRRVNAAESLRLSARMNAEKPSYAAPAGAPYTAEDVVVTTAGGFQLAGTLTHPRGAAKAPVVVTISGSGPQDRDSRIVGIADYAIFREVADTLGRRGIAVLRVDDRGIGASTGRETLPVATSADYASDVREVVKYLRSRKDIDTSRIALLGHSEGGMIAPMVAAGDKGIRAIALLAGPAYTGRRISMFQNQDTLNRMKQLTQAARDSIMRTVPAQLDAAGRQIPWLGFYLQHDPVVTARQVTQPVLILQGGTDFQITPEQADTLAAAFRAGGNTDVTMRKFPATNHLFLPDSVGGAAGYATLPDKRVRREVLGAIADWFVARFR